MARHAMLSAGGYRTPVTSSWPMPTAVTTSSSLPCLERQHHADDIGRGEPLDAHGDAAERVSISSSSDRKQIAADLTGRAKPFLSLPRLLIEASVLNSDARGGRKSRDQLLILCGEICHVSPVGEIQIAEHPLPLRMGTPRKVVIGGWPSGNA
jgi:hypothetical protein